MKKTILLAALIAAFLLNVPGALAATPDIQVTDVSLSKSSFSVCEPLTLTATIKENWVTELGEVNRGESTDSINIPTYTVTFYYYRDKIVAAPAAKPPTTTSKTTITDIISKIKLPIIGRIVDMFAVKPAVTTSAKTYIWPSTAVNGEKIYKMGEMTVPAHKLWNDPRVSNVRTVTFKYWATPEIDNYVIGAFADFSGAAKETDAQRKNNQLEKQTVTAASYGRCAPLLNLADGSYATFKMPSTVAYGTPRILEGGSATAGDYTINADSVVQTDRNDTDSAFITVCRGDDCSASTGFKLRETKDLTVGAVTVKLRLDYAISTPKAIGVTLLGGVQSVTFKAHTNGGKNDAYANVVFEKTNEVVNGIPSGMDSSNWNLYEKGAPGAGTIATVINDATPKKVAKVINVEADKDGKVTNAQVCIYDPYPSLYLTSPNGGEISTGNIPIAWCADRWAMNMPVNIGYVSTDPNVIMAHGSDPVKVKSIIGNVVNQPASNPYIWDGKGDKNGAFNGKRLPTGKYKIFITDTANLGLSDESDGTFTISPVIQQAKP